MLKSDTEATILAMAIQIGDIHGSMETLEKSMHAGLAAQTIATTALGTELRGLLQQLLEKSDTVDPDLNKRRPARSSSPEGRRQSTPYGD